MSIHALKPSGENDPIRQAKIDLAAAHRLAAYHELEEGIDNHFTVTAPVSSNCSMSLALASDQ